MVLGEFKKKVMEEIKIGVVGLGYVGLPLARLFATKYAVVGFDLKKERIEALNRGIDRTLEVSEEVMKSVLRPSVPKRGEKGLYCSCDPEDLRDCNYYIITVPTPVDKHNRPDLTPLIRASETVGQVIVRGDIVIYESTVYPGATEEDCIPVIERVSGLKYNVDFFAGYSPERINPGDKQHTVEKIKKVTSGSTPGVAEKVNALYHSVIVAGTHLAPSIRVAEAAKVIENSQRDINIAFMNELAIAFHLMHIDTNEVLKAMNTKWNALGFRPGLVGGHCIGVDPYYFIYQAEKLGYHSKIIGAGRRINDSMSGYVVKQMVKEMIRNHVDTRHAKIYLLGMTFKEDCPDVRNSRAVDIFHGLKEMGFDPIAVDPAADQADFERLYHVPLVPLSAVKDADVIAVLVAHKEFKALSSAEVRSLFATCPEEETPLLFDVKSIYDPKKIRGEGLAYWNL